MKICTNIWKSPYDIIRSFSLQVVCKQLWNFYSMINFEAHYLTQMNFQYFWKKIKTLGVDCLLRHYNHWD